MLPIGRGEKMIKWLKHIWNTTEFNVGCNKCHCNSNHRFTKGKAIEGNEITCPICGHKGETYFNECRGGWQHLYMR